LVYMSTQVFDFLCSIGPVTDLHVYIVSVPACTYDEALHDFKEFHPDDFDRCFASDQTPRHYSNSL